MTNKPQFIASWSGKGGVGKTRLSVAMARVLAAAGKKVGIVDMDVLNPNLDDTLGVGKQDLQFTTDRIKPCVVDGFQYMTLGIIPESQLANLFDSKFTSTIALQLLDAVDWTGVDHLILDMAPGTGDLPKTLFERFGKKDCVVLVTGPRDEELADAERALDALKEWNVRCVGAIINFQYVQTPDGSTWPIGHNRFEIEERLKVPILFDVPLCVFPGQRVEDHVKAGLLFEAVKPKWSLFS